MIGAFLKTEPRNGVGLPVLPTRSYLPGLTGVDLLIGKEWGGT